ncbi:hypothetical protein GCM10009754_26950 [Amycolatopsis minnesotensis]|uniref:DUF5753 domain-containing protein n=1 Tax=Amycolatopsis minnesotensis TaxID=337894 RepID=A0ABN2QR28_9PSEU
MSEKRRLRLGWVGKQFSRNLALRLYLALLDEATLRRPVGDRPVMAAQLRRLVEQCRAKPQVDVRVIPFEAGPHTGLDGTYVLMEFAKARSIAYLEHKRSSLFLDASEEVEPFQRATAKDETRWILVALSGASPATAAHRATVSR